MRPASCAWAFLLLVLGAGIAQAQGDATPPGMQVIPGAVTVPQVVVVPIPTAPVTAPVAPRAAPAVPSVVVVPVQATGTPAATPAQAAPEVCRPPPPEQQARVQQVYRGGPGTLFAQRTDTRAPAAVPVELRDTIGLVITNLPALVEEQRCRNRPIVLYLNGQAVPGATVYPPSNPVDGTIHFQVRPSDLPEDEVASRRVWTSILGRPLRATTPVRVSVGLDNQYPISSDAVLKLTVIPRWWFAFWLVLFVVALGAFLWLARSSDIVRAALAPAPATGRRPYSLSRVQAAWWFFLILAAYLFIAIVTGVWNTGINATALGLLGIAAGTTVVSTVIDANKNQPSLDVDNETAAIRLSADIQQAEAELQPLADRLQAATALIGAALEAARQAGTARKQLEDAPNAIPAAAAQAVASASRAAAAALRVAAGQTDAAATAVTDAAARIEAACAPMLAPVAGGPALTPAEALAAAIAASDLAKEAADGTALKTLQAQFAEGQQRARAKLVELRSKLEKARRRSEGIFVDLVSDANGVSFHRFQLLILTVVVGVVFVHGVWRDLTMPEFDGGLFGLLGLSSLSYLGLKGPEATVPRVAP